MVDRKRIKKGLMKEIISYAKSEDTVEHKKKVQELYREYRKKGLNPREAWGWAKIYFIHKATVFLLFFNST